MRPLKSQFRADALTTLEGEIIFLYEEETVLWRFALPSLG
jgi:hypothetical protein